MYRVDPDKRKAAANSLYRAEPDAVHWAVYKADPEKQKAAVRAYYRNQPEKKRGCG